jgi:hypothetical protein
MTRAVLACCCFAALYGSANAQNTVGAALMVTIQAAPDDVPGTFSPPPGGSAPGVLLFGAAAITTRILIGGEFSFPIRMTTVRMSSHPGGDFTDTRAHRDVTLSSLVRVRVHPRYCDLVVGPGLVFTSTLGASVFVARSPAGGFVTTQSRLNTKRLAFTLGADVPVPLHNRLSLVPSVRFHWMSRPEWKDPGGNSRPIGQPGALAVRFAFGARVAF